MTQTVVRLGLLFAFVSLAYGATPSCEEPTAKAPLLIAHALGGIEGHDYTNSHEAFQLSARSGFRWYEIDFLEVADREVVAYHNLDSLRKDFGITGHISGLDAKKFFRQKYFGKYSPLGLTEVLRLLQQSPDTCLILDLKDSRHRRQRDDLRHDPLQFARLHKKIFDAVRRLDATLLARIVPQIYAPEDLDALRRLHRYPRVIFTLYRSSLRDEEVVRFVARNREIRYVAVDRPRFTPELPAALSQHGVRALVYTVNDPAEMRQYLTLGVAGIYTDWISPQRYRTLAK